MEWYEDAIRILDNNGVILSPSDTVWGLSGNALSSEVVIKIHELKQRPKSKSFIVLVSDFEMLKNYVEQIPEQVLTYLNKKTRPTTVIYTNPIGLPKEVLAKDGSIGIRISSEKWLSDFIRQFGKPIISTSANISGKETPTFFNQISDQIKGEVDYIVPYLQACEKAEQSSQIIKTNSSGEIIKIR